MINLEKYKDEFKKIVECGNDEEKTVEIMGNIVMQNSYLNYNNIYPYQRFIKWLFQEESLPEIDDQEYVILSNLNKKYKYITRDDIDEEECGLLKLFTVLPDKINGGWHTTAYISNYDYTFLECYNHLFKSIRPHQPYVIAAILRNFEEANKESYIEIPIIVEDDD